MAEIITINNYELPVREYNGQRVVTFKDIDAVHGKSDGNARKRFNDNRERFIDDVDCFVLDADEAMREYGITAPNGLNLITKHGYLLLVKLFNDDLAWQVQRELTDTYFEVKSAERRAARLDSGKINKWKWYVANPLIKKLHSMNKEDNMSRVYGMVYRDMSENFAFDMNNEKVEYCRKYDVPANEIAIIDIIAASPLLRGQFLKSVKNCIENIVKCEIESIREFENSADECLNRALKINESFEMEIKNNKLVDGGACGMALTT